MNQSTMVKMEKFF